MRLLVRELTEESKAARSSIGDPHGDLLWRGGEVYGEAILQVHGFLLGVPIAHDALTFGHALRVDAQSPWQRDATRDPILTHEAWLTQRQGDAGCYPLTWNMRIVDPGAGRWIPLLQAYRRLENTLIERRILRVTLPAAPALHAGAAGIVVFAEVVAASTGVVGKVRPCDRVSVGILKGMVSPRRTISTGPKT